MLSPERYAEMPVYELLQAAASGKIGVDHRFLHAIVDRPDDAIPDLLRWGLSDHEEDPIDLEDDLIAIFRHLKRPEAVPYLTHVIKLDPEYTPEELVPAFLSIKDEALEPLLELYDELDEEQSGDVAFMLAALRIPDERVLNILVERLEYDAGDAALMLGLYGDPAAREPLEQMLEQIPAEDLHLQNEVKSALEQLGRPVDETPDAYDIWEDYPEYASPHFDLLDDSERLDMLRTGPTPEVRAAAAASFVNRDLSESARKAIFQAAQTDESPEVRGAAWEALHNELDQGDIRKAMFARLSDESAPLEERAGALVGLSLQATKPDVRPYVLEFYENPDTRARALEAMWRSLDREFLQYPPQHLDDADGEVRRQAIWGVGYLTITSAAERLIPIFQEDEFRPDALYAYALSTKHETSRAYIKRLLRRIEELAGGLTEDEQELVQLALDERLALYGHEPVFYPESRGS
ncbi:MAG TPA: HEAT repeat domain-containing protein [Bryobacteraceae bacterium]|jgi:HEAT repeat protein|nr:HEAT repeat domain-containing protein [Bryobacteraceae bacterium]